MVFALLFVKVTQTGDSEWTSSVFESSCHGRGNIFKCLAQQGHNKLTCLIARGYVTEIADYWTMV